MHMHSTAQHNDMIVLASDEQHFEWIINKLHVIKIRVSPQQASIVNILQHDGGGTYVEVYACKSSYIQEMHMHAHIHIQTQSRL